MDLEKELEEHPECRGELLGRSIEYWKKRGVLR